MPTINIPPKVRFILYLIGAIALLSVSYAVDKQWAGDAEVRYVTGLAALLQLLAAAKTSLSDTSAVVTGTVVSETGETGAIAATIGDGAEPQVTAAEHRQRLDENQARIDESARRYGLVELGEHGTGDPYEDRSGHP